MEHLIEVTEELFFSIIDSGYRNKEVIHKDNYTDVIYEKYGVTLVYRSHFGLINYYIQDINA